MEFFNKVGFLDFVSDTQLMAAIRHGNDTYVCERMRGVVPLSTIDLYRQG